MYQASQASLRRFIRSVLSGRLCPYRLENAARRGPAASFASPPDRRSRTVSLRAQVMESP